MESTKKSTKLMVFSAACVGWIHDAFNLTIITLLAADIQQAFGIGNTAMGFLFSGQFIATFFGAIFFGSIADRILLIFLLIFGGYFS